MGYLVADKFGFVFSFGIYIDGIYIPERLTYVLAESQVNNIYINSLYLLCLLFSLNPISYKPYN